MLLVLALLPREIRLTEINNQHLYIDTEDGLADLLGELDRAESVAIDIEADSLHHFFEKVCLIQLTFDEQNYIIDPLADVDLSSLMEMLSHKILLIHDAGYDLRMLNASFGFEVHGQVFDTMQAAQLIGIEKFGLAALCEHYLGVIIPKTGQKSDWSRRPLTESQLQYAAVDTSCLHKLAELIEADLRRLGRLSWHEETCTKIVNAALEPKPEVDPDSLWRIKGARLLPPEILVYVKHIWQWRDAEARSVDLPPFKILGHESLISLATWASQNPEKHLSKGPRLPRTCAARRLKCLEEMIEKARLTPKDQLPKKPKRNKSHAADPEIKERVEELRERIAVVAETLEIKPHLIASKATVKAIVKADARSFDQIVRDGHTMNWQAELLAPVVDQ
jgi:ribonuclease D